MLIFVCEDSSAYPNERWWDASQQDGWLKLRLFVNQMILLLQLKCSHPTRSKRISSCGNPAGYITCLCSFSFISCSVCLLFLRRMKWDNVSGSDCPEAGTLCSQLTSSVSSWRETQVATQRNVRDALQSKSCEAGSWLTLLFQCEWGASLSWERTQLFCFVESCQNKLLFLSFHHLFSGERVSQIFALQMTNLRQFTHNSLSSSCNTHIVCKSTSIDIHPDGKEPFVLVWSSRINHLTKHECSYIHPDDRRSSVELRCVSRTPF